MAELADALDLGSSGQPWGFESPLSHFAHVVRTRIFRRLSPMTASSGGQLARFGSEEGRVERGEPLQLSSILIGHPAAGMPAQRHSSTVRRALAVFGSP